MPPETALPPSAWLAGGLLVGVALAPTDLRVGALVPLVPLVPWLLVLLAVLARKRRPRVAAGLLVLAAVGLGFFRGVTDHTEATVRARWLPPEGVAAELHLTGVVLRAAELDAQGEHRLRLKVRPERSGSATRELTALFRVASSSPDATARLEALATGDRVRLWARIRRPRTAGNPGERDASTTLRAQGLDALGRVKNAELVERLAPGAAGPARVADRLRSWARKRFDRSLGGSSSARVLVGAMLLGDRAKLSDDRQRMLRRAGLAHLVAISGLHVGLILWAVHAALGRAFGLRGWGRWFVTVMLLGGFALVVGGRASVWRAVLGAGAWLGGRCLGREGTAIQQLILVAAILSWLRPWSLGGPGFQLTFLAVAGILAFARPIRDLLPLPPALGLGPAVGAAAYLATAPAVAWHFGSLAPVGLLTNLLALPVCAAVLVAGFALLALGELPGIGSLAVNVCEWATTTLWWTADLAPALDGGTLAVSPPERFLVWLYYGLLVSVARVPRGRVARRVLVTFLGLLMIWVHLGAPPASPSGKMELRLFDVGQGLSVALRGVDGGVVLFDTGGTAIGHYDPGERIVVPSLLRWSGKRIEALVLSHGDVDHAGGASAVLERLEVGELWLGPKNRASPLLARVRNVARSRRVPVVLAERGGSSRVSGIPLRVLGPHRAWMGQGTNDASVVVLAGERPYRILLTGDLESRGEAELLSSQEPLRAEVLIVAHHGSRSGSCSAFLERVRPDWALVSAGFGNRFGHPHTEVQRRIAIAGARLLRTDLDGAVSLRAAATGWSVDRFRVRKEVSARGSPAVPE